MSYKKLREVYKKKPTEKIAKIFMWFITKHLKTNINHILLLKKYAIKNIVSNVLNVRQFKTFLKI